MAVVLIVVVVFWRRLWLLLVDGEEVFPAVQEATAAAVLGLAWCLVWLSCGGAGW